MLDMVQWVRAQANEIAGMEGDFGETIAAPDLSDRERSRIAAEVTIHASLPVRTEFEHLMETFDLMQHLGWHRQDVQFFAEQ